MRFAEGGFQPLTSPSLAAHPPSTPPGHAYIYYLLNYTHI
jgi:hypothetical protein